MNNGATLRVCRGCNYFGTLPENYCPLCGTQLIAECGACTTPISNPFARYCVNCGEPLSESPGEEEEGGR